MKDAGPRHHVRFRPAPKQSSSRVPPEIVGDLRSAESIQEYMDRIPYNPETTCRSPLRVRRDGTANCMEGALFAVFCLKSLGYPASLVYINAVRDDGHAVAVFRKNGRFGGLAKSNFTGLRYRSPIYRTVRELIASYFDHHYNTAGELTARGYTRPWYPPAGRYPGWESREDDLFDVTDGLDRLKTHALLDPRDARSLRKVDEKLLQAGLLGSDPRGLYKVRSREKRC